MPHASWAEFCQDLLSGFGPNQHQSLIRKLFRIAQITTVEDYVERFAEP